MTGSKQTLQFAALAAAVVLAFSTGAFAAGEEHEHEHGKTEAKLVLDHGKKWRTDDVARKGMDAVRAALAANLKAIHAGRQTDAEYQALAQKVNAEVAHMIQNCKLEPKVDAQFHLVLEALIDGVEKMEGKQGAARREGAERAARALNDYGRHFEHPGWRRL